MRLKGKFIHNFPSKYIYYIFDYTTTNKWRQVFDAIYWHISFDFDR